MTDDQLIANIEQYLQAAGLNVPPPPITSDPLVTGGAPIEQLLRILGIAANAGDPRDNAESSDQHADREAKLNEAAAKFLAQDEDAANQLKNVTDQGAAQMAQQLPQLASGIAGSLAGALGGILQPMSQIPQQMTQGAQQAMQTAMGMAQQFGGSMEGSSEDAISDLTDEPGSGAYAFDDFGGGGSGAGGGSSIGLTAPTAMLGPPPVPSAATSPSSVPTVPALPPATASAASTHTPGMAGMPMMPPGAMRPGDGSQNEPKPDAKRLSVPTIKNGAPVQGRITTPPPTPQVVKKIEGNPVATRRIIVPNNKILRDSDDENPHRT